MLVLWLGTTHPPFRALARRPALGKRPSPHASGSSAGLFIFTPKKGGLSRLCTVNLDYFGQAENVHLALPLAKKFEHDKNFLPGLLD